MIGFNVQVLNWLIFLLFRFLSILKDFEVSVYECLYRFYKEEVGIPAKHLCACFFSFIFLFSPNGE